jgi:hypothetical protein
MSEAVICNRGLSKAAQWTGNKVFAEALVAYGADYFFHVPVIIPGAVVEMTSRDSPSPPP